MGGVILHLCADTGSDSYPFLQNGYDVIKVGKDVGVENFNYSGEVFGVFANPVCTEFSIANNFKKIGDYEKGMFLVNHCLRVIKECKPKFWVLENPARGKLSQFIGEPKEKYQPWEYGSPWTKETALWGDFNMPKRKYNNWSEVPNKNDKLYIKKGRDKPNMHLLHKSAIKNIDEFSRFDVESDMEFRSLCSQKFAKQFYEVNKND